MSIFDNIILKLTGFIGIPYTIMKYLNHHTYKFYYKDKYRIINNYNGYISIKNNNEEEDEKNKGK